MRLCFEVAAEEVLVGFGEVALVEDEEELAAFAAEGLNGVRQAGGKVPGVAGVASVGCWIYRAMDNLFAKRDCSFLCTEGKAQMDVVYMSETAKVGAKAGSVLIPSVRYKDAHAAIVWLERVLGFELQAVHDGPDGRWRMHS